jgi:hypothetical protein
MLGDKNIRPISTRILNARLWLVATLTGTSQYVTAKITVYVEAKLRLRLIKNYVMKTHGIQQAFHISVLRPSFTSPLGGAYAVFNG